MRASFASLSNGFALGTLRALAKSLKKQGKGPGTSA